MIQALEPKRFAENMEFPEAPFTSGERSIMDSMQLRRLKELEEENRKLKQMFADVSLDNRMLKDVLSKKW